LTDPTAALAQLGWDERRTTGLGELGYDLSAAARIVRVDRGLATLRAADGTERGTPSLPVAQPLAARCPEAGLGMS
jgi:hypothetical protein